VRFEEVNSEFENRFRKPEEEVLPTFQDIVGDEKVNEQLAATDSENTEPKTKKNKSNAGAKQVSRKVSSTFLKVLNGDFLTHNSSTKQLPFILFLAIIAILYIANGYYAERTVRQINDANKELKELHSEYITTKSTLMQVSTQSSVARLAAAQVAGLQESKEAPKKIIVESKK
jgi:hypothetical protein